MGKDYSTDKAAPDAGQKAPPRTAGSQDSSTALQQQAGNQAVQGALRDTPAFDDYSYRTQGSVPRTTRASAGPAALAEHGHAAMGASAAVADFVRRFPFLKDLLETYRAHITQTLGSDQQDYRDFRRVNTPENNLYLDPSMHPYSMPAGAYRLAALGKFEFPSVNEKRAETISPDLFFSSAFTEPPVSPLAESDEHTYLRETFQKITKQPVYLMIDGWSKPALQIYITDGTFSWEVLSSPRPVEIADILAIDMIRRQYVTQQTSGPKRTAIEGAISEATAGLVTAQGKDQYQAQVDEEAAIGVVRFSKWRGKRAGFDQVVDEYESVVYGEMAEKKRAAYEPTYLEQIGFLLEAFSKAFDALHPADALSAQYLRGLNEDQKAAEFWKNVQLYCGIADDSRRWKLEFTPEEWDAVKKEATARAEKDWEAAPDVLPDEPSFNRAAEVIAMATKYLDHNDLEAASIYASLALHMEQLIATSVERYKIRVTTGASRMAQTLEHVKAGSHFLLTLMAPFAAGGLGLTGVRLLAAGAAVPAAFTAVSSIASGEDIGHSLFEAQKEFITGVLVGKLSEMMSASFVAQFAIPRPAADILANATASPYGAAGDILFRKMINPNAPLPTLEELKDEMMKSVAVGSLVTIATHAAVSINAPRDPVAEPSSGKQTPPEAKPLPENKMSGTMKGPADSPVTEPSTVKDKYARFNEEWTGVLRMQGPGVVNVLPSRSGPELTFGTFKRNIRTATEAYDAFNEAVARTKGREVGIIRNIETGEYMVQVGGAGSVGAPTGQHGTFETVLHTHPNDNNILTYRLPSGVDVALARETSAHLGGRPVTQFIEYPLPSGGRGRTAYTVEASGKIRVEFVRARTGKAEAVEFSSVKEFQEYWDSRTRFAEPGSEDYKDLMYEAEQTLQNRKDAPDENKMSGRAKDPSLDPDWDPDAEPGDEDYNPDPVGYDSRLGVRKKTITPDDLVHAREMRKLERELKIEKGTTFPPEVQELIWEVNDAGLGHPDPMALYLARLRGTERDLNFRDFIIPKLREIMPADSVFGARDYVALRERLGVDKLPWESRKAGGGPDLFFVKGNTIQPLDLTTQGASEQTHMDRLESQMEALRKQLGDGWTVNDPEHFYHGRGKFNDATVITQIASYVKRFGGKIPAGMKSKK